MDEISQGAQAAPFTQANSDGRPIYEVGFHIIPNVSDEAAAQVVEKIHALLESAEIISEQAPSSMTLAYTIERAAQGKREKFNESYFGFIKFATEREHIPALQQALRATPEVLRSIVIETVREDAPAPRRAVFSSTRLEGEIIKKPEAPEEKPADVSEEELDKSIDALVA